MILFKFAYIRCKPWLMDKRRRREDPTSPNRDSIETLGMWEKRHLLCGLYAEKTNDVLSPSIEFVHYSRIYDRSAIEPDRLPQSRAITNRGTGQQVAVCWWSWEIWMLMWLCDSGWRWNPAGKQINLVDVAASSLSSPGRGPRCLISTWCSDATIFCWTTMGCAYICAFCLMINLLASVAVSQMCADSV